MSNYSDKEIELMRAVSKRDDQIRELLRDLSQTKAAHESLVRRFEGAQRDLAEANKKIAQYEHDRQHAVEVNNAYELRYDKLRKASMELHKSLAERLRDASRQVAQLSNRLIHAARMAESDVDAARKNYEPTTRAMSLPKDDADEY